MSRPGVLRFHRMMEGQVWLGVWFFCLVRTELVVVCGCGRGAGHKNYPQNTQGFFRTDVYTQLGANENRDGIATPQTNQKRNRRI